MIKTGPGTWTLSGTNNTYTGATTVNAGTLQVNGTLAPGTAAVTVNSTATLAGTGTINRPVTAATGGTVAPGVVNGAGALSASSATFNSGSTFLVRIVGGIPAGFETGGSTDSTTTPTTNGLLRVTGGSAPTFDPNAAVIVDFSTAGLTQGSTYSYVLLTGATPGTNPFTLSQVQFIGNPTSGADLFTDPAGNVILTFTPVPEPGFVLLVGAAGLSVVARLRRRRVEASALAA